MSQVFKLNTFGFGAAPEDGILRADTLEAMGGANALIAEAEAQAEEIRVSAEEAYAAEKQRGFTEGMDAANAERAAQLLRDQHQIDGKLAELERDLGMLVFDSVKKIIEGFDDDALARETARSALASMRKERRGQLFVSSANYAATQAAVPGLIATFPEIELIDVIEDTELTAPNVRLESSLGVVAFVLDETLEALRQNLEQK